MRNEHKKITSEDKFARKYFGDKTKKAIKKFENRNNNKKMRRHSKKLIKKELKNL